MKDEKGGGCGRDATGSEREYGTTGIFSANIEGGEFNYASKKVRHALTGSLVSQTWRTDPIGPWTP